MAARGVAPGDSTRATAVIARSRTSGRLRVRSGVRLARPA